MEKSHHVKSKVYNRIQTSFSFSLHQFCAFTWFQPNPIQFSSLTHVFLHNFRFISTYSIDFLIYNFPEFLKLQLWKMKFIFFFQILPFSTLRFTGWPSTEPLKKSWSQLSLTPLTLLRNTALGFFCWDAS